MRITKMTGEVEPRTFNAGDMINRGDFVKVSTDDLETDGYARGTLFFVANMQALPITEEDPYLQRLFACVHKVEQNWSLNTTMIALVDPKNLEKVDDETKELYISMVEAHYIPEKDVKVVN